MIGVRVKEYAEFAFSRLKFDKQFEKLSTFYLFQSISMAIQKGNAVCVMGCPKDNSSGLDGQFNFQVHEAEAMMKKYLYLYPISFLLP